MFELTGIAKRHDGREVLRVDRLALGGAGVTVILGHNGSGKSTLLSILARQSRPDEGETLLDGAPLAGFAQRRLARRVAYLPQRLPPVPGLTVRELVRLGRYAWRGPFAPWRAEDRTAVARAMERTGTTGFADTLADSLSGGERQRAWIAMLLAQDAPVLLLDEPTAALDLAHAYDVMDLLARLARDDGRRVLVVLHDINLAARFGERVLALKSGRIAFDGGPGDFLSPNLLHDLYGLDMALLDGPQGPVAVVA